jgi:hypothetical protein
MAVYMLTWSMVPVISMPVAAAADAAGAQQTVFALGLTLVAVLVAIRLFYPGFAAVNERYATGPLDEGDASP